MKLTVNVEGVTQSNKDDVCTEIADFLGAVWTYCSFQTEAIHDNDDDDHGHHESGRRILAIGRLYMTIGVALHDDHIHAKLDEINADPLNLDIIKSTGVVLHSVEEKRTFEIILSKLFLLSLIRALI